MYMNMAQCYSAGHFGPWVSTNRLWRAIYGLHIDLKPPRRIGGLGPHFTTTFTTFRSFVTSSFRFAGGIREHNPQWLRTTPMLTESSGLGVGFGNIPDVYTCFLSSKMPKKLWVPQRCPGPHRGSLQRFSRPPSWWEGNSLPVPK